MVSRLQTPITQIEAFILAGGASSRMGTDKSQLLLDDQTFVERIAATLLTVTDSIRLVGGRENSTFASKLATVPDVYPQWGALGGLHAALSACRRDWAIVVACDLPFVTSELFRTLASMRGDYDAPHDAIVPVQPDGRPQPLAALYRVDPCARRATELIEAGRRRPLDLLQSVNTRWVDFAEIANLDQAQMFFVNINTPDDYYGIIRGLNTDR